MLNVPFDHHDKSDASENVVQENVDTVDGEIDFPIVPFAWVKENIC